jgi:hypothetical protein
MSPARRRTERATQVPEAAATGARPRAAAGPRALQRQAGNEAVGRLLEDASLGALITPPGPGTVLAPALRATLESAFGRDLGHVRVHEGPAARATTALLGARAFTAGRDVWLGRDAPGDTALIGHEVAHVIQQGAAPPAARIGADAGAAEHAAAQAGAAVAAGQAAGPVGSASAGVQRAPDPRRRPAEELLADPEVTERVREVGEDPSAATQQGAGGKTKDFAAPKARRPGDRSTPELAAEELAARRRAAAHKLERVAQSGIAEADNYRSLQLDQIENQRGILGLLSDFSANNSPPYIGAWANARGRFERALALLAANDLRGAFVNVVTGAEALADAKRAWHEYLETSIESAGGIAGMLEIVRDTAFAAEVALLTGGAAAGALGGGALGAAGGTVFGVGVAVESARKTEGKVGDAVRGTLDEAVRRGLLSNLRLAANGVAGIAYGVGEVLRGMPRALIDVLIWLEDVFKDPRRLARDAGTLKRAVRTLNTTIAAQWDALAALPEDKQAFFVGRAFGQIEGSLIAMEAGGQIGRGLGGAIEGLPLPSPGLSAAGVGSIFSSTAETVGDLVKLQEAFAGLGKGTAIVTAMAAVVGTPSELPKPASQPPATPSQGPASQLPKKPPSKARLKELMGLLNRVDERFWPMAKNDARAVELAEQRREIEGLISAGQAEEAEAAIKRFRRALYEAQERQLAAGQGFSRAAASAEARGTRGLSRGALRTPLENIEGVRRVPDTLPGPGAFSKDVNVGKASFKSPKAAQAQLEIFNDIENGKILSTTGGNRYERLVKPNLAKSFGGKTAAPKNFKRPGRTPDYSAIEITIEGRSMGFSQHKLQQLWLDLVDLRQIKLVVPKLCTEAADQLRRLGAGAELLGIEVEILVVETLP